MQGTLKDGPSLKCQEIWDTTGTIDSAIVTSTLRNLGALYRRQGKLEAAETLEEAATVKQQCAPTEKRSDSGHIQKQCSSESLSSEVMVKYDLQGGEEVSMSLEWNGDGSGSLKRSGSLSKLRASLRRSSEKLVRRLKGGGGGGTSPSSGAARETEPKPPG